MIKELGPAALLGFLLRLHVPLSHVDRRDFAVMSQAHLDRTPPRQYKEKGPCVTFLILPLWKMMKHPRARTAYQCSWTTTDAAFSVFSYHSLVPALSS